MSTIKRSVAAICAGLFLVAGVALAQSTMTDTQVLEYVQQAMASGKGRDEMVAELSLRGVNRAQAERVYALYQQRQGSAEAKSVIQDQGRQHSVNAVGDEEMESSDIVAAGEMQVFGRDIFRNRTMNFAPSENMATPRNYKLGPGDEVIIDIFGHNQATLRQTISPEGSINVDILGPLYLSGKTIDAFRNDTSIFF